MELLVFIKKLTSFPKCWRSGYTKRFCQLFCICV